MTPAVGFLLLTHHKPHQTVRLINKLNCMFDYPPIVCHHNFSITDLPTDSLSENVVLVRPHVETKWGKFSIIEAELRAMQLMYENPSAPDWLISLSGSDYPIKPAERILQDLSSSLHDVHIHHELVDFNDYGNKDNWTGWQKLGLERYCALKFWVPWIEENFRLKKQWVTLIKNPSLTSFFLPFSEDLRCFVGEACFCANRKAVEYLLKFHATNPILASYYRRFTIFPTESYYHTAFCNASHFKVDSNNWRYIDWSITGDPHPKILLIEDLPKIQASSAHFARKFDIDVDAQILNELDAIT